MVATRTTTSTCRNCGFEAPAGEWTVVDHPTLGSVTSCPECGSTDVRSGE